MSNIRILLKRLNFNNLYDIVIDSNVLPKIYNDVKEGYILWNDNCRIPNISAYDKSIVHLIQKNVAPNCSSNAPLTSVILDISTWSYTLKINHDFNSQVSKSIVNCCYSSIVRNELKLKKNLRDDDRYK